MRNRRATQRWSKPSVQLYKRNKHTIYICNLQQLTDGTTGLPKEHDLQYARPLEGDEASNAAPNRGAFAVGRHAMVRGQHSWIFQQELHSRQNQSRNVGLDGRYGARSAQQTLGKVGPIPDLANGILLGAAAAEGGEADGRGVGGITRDWHTVVGFATGTTPNSSICTATATAICSIVIISTQQTVIVDLTHIPGGQAGIAGIGGIVGTILGPPISVLLGVEVDDGDGISIAIVGVDLGQHTVTDS